MKKWILLILLFVVESTALAASTPPSINSPQPANTFFAGPASGSPAVSTWRVPVLLDLPSIALGTGLADSAHFLRGDRTWATYTTGTVTTVSVATANGFAGTVTSATTTPVITIDTTITGLLKGNGTAVSAAVAGTDFVAPSTTVNGHALTGNVVITPTDLSLVIGTNTEAWSTNLDAFSAKTAPAGVVIGTTDTQTLTNKNLNSGTNTFPTFNQNTTGSAATLTTARALAGNSFNGSADVPFANLFIVQGTTDAGLTNAQFLGALSTGIVKNNTTTGVLSIATGADLPTMTSTVGGAVPTPPNNTNTFLRGDGAFAAPTGSGTVNSGTAGQMGYYAGSGAAISGNANATISSGALTLGTGGFTQGQLLLSNTTAGATTLSPGATASGTLTLPSGTDTLVAKNTTDTLTNKDLTSGTNTFPTFNQNTTGTAANVTTNANLTGPITSTGNATAIASQTGTGTKFVVDTSPTLVTPVLGVASATTINKVTLTAPATGSTLTVVDGKTLTSNNTLTLAGTDATTMTFPSTSATVARTDAANTFTGHQTIEGITTTGATGTGNLVFGSSPTLVTASLGSSTATTQSPGDNSTKLATTAFVTAAGGGSGGALTPTAVKTANYSAATGDFVPVDTTSGNITITLPTAPADKASIAVKQVIRGGTNTISVVTGGADVFNKAGGSTTFTITIVSQAAEFQYSASPAIWYVVTDDLPYGSLLANANTWSGAQTFTAPLLGTPFSGNLANCTFPTLNQSTTGSAATLTTPRAINGTNFDGSAAITITAAAGTLTGATLNSGVTASSLTSVGTLTSPILTTPVINGTITGTGQATAATASTIVMRDSSANIAASNYVGNYTTTATAAGTTTLTVASTYLQFFTGSTTQTVTMPVAGTLTLGQQFAIVNNSTGVVTIQTSGSNTLQAMVSNSYLQLTCILTSGTNTSSWSVAYSQPAVSTNTANTIVLRDSSGNFAAGTINKVTLTAPATGSTLTVTDGKTLTANNTLTLAGTDSTTMTFPSTSAAIARTDAANTFTGHQTIEGVVTTGATGTNLLVFGTTPTITTPVIASGLTASGSGANTFVSSTGTFITSTGANTLSGAVTINDAATPSVTLATGKTNTGFLQINGKTSGSTKYITADATAQAVTVNTAAQTTGSTTLTIPDQAGTSRNFVLDTLTQTLTNKTLSSPSFSGTFGAPITVNNGGTNQGTANYSNGDLIRYVSASSALTGLNLGTAGKILRSSGTQPSWAYPYLSNVQTADLSLNATTDCGTHVQMSGGHIVTLPTAAQGLEFTVENTDSSTSNFVTIKTSAGSQLIDGVDCSSTGYVLTAQYSKVCLRGVSNTQWSVTSCVGDIVCAPAIGVATTGQTATANTAVNLQSIVLSPGQWDLTAVVDTAAGSIIAGTTIEASISTTSATLGSSFGDDTQHNLAGSVVGLSIPAFRQNVTGSTTYYLVFVYNGTSGSSSSIFGRISARRIR